MQDYRESNTRFLAAHHHWSGIIIDGGTAHVDFVTNSDIDWRHEVRAISALVTKDNFNRLSEEGGLSGDIGLLSIDVDGCRFMVA